MDYYMNMNLIYSKNDNAISQLSFYQAPYSVYVQNLIISNFDSIPYNLDTWDDYEVFDLR